MKIPAEKLATLIVERFARQSILFMPIHKDSATAERPVIQITNNPAIRRSAADKPASVAVQDSRLHLSGLLHHPGGK